MLNLSKPTFRGQWAKSACNYCPQKYTCIGCSWLGRKAYRQFYFENILHEKPPPTSAMIKGREKHEELRRKSGAREYKIGDYFWKKLKRERYIKVAESHICSRQYGLNGHFDHAEITIKGPYGKNPLRCFFNIKEWKSWILKSYWLQLYGYALIISDRNFLMGEEEFYRKAGLENASVNLTVTLSPYSDGKYSRTIPIIKDNVFVKPEIRMAVTVQKRRYLDIISHKKTNGSLPKCDPCREETCSFQKFCSNVKPTKQITLFQACGVRKRKVK